MIKFKFTLVGILFATSVLFAQEVSVFGAGDLKSSNPYGLTKSEDMTYQNQQRIQDLEEKLQGLSTLIDGLNQQISDLNNKIEDLQARKGFQKKKF